MTGEGQGVATRPARTSFAQHPARQARRARSAEKKVTEVNAVLGTGREGCSDLRTGSGTRGAPTNPINLRNPNTRQGR